MRFVNRDTLVQNLPVGTILWRPVHIGDVVEVVPHKFKVADDGKWITRVLPNGKFLNEPELTNSPRGVVVFVNPFDERYKDDDWTHLVVTGSGRGGNCFFAKVSPAPLDEYEKFRRDMAIRYNASKDKHHAEKAKAMEDAIEAEPGETRVFLSLSEGGWYMQELKDAAQEERVF